MFTGIVDHRGLITEAESVAGGLRVCIQTQFKDLVLGESIAVDGICLTVTDFENGLFAADLSPETLAKTTAKHWGEGVEVHLERALKVGDRLGGHWVTGHIDGCVEVASISQFDDYRCVEIQGMPAEHLNYLVSKGSVALNGVSLTVNKLTSSGFVVMLVPYTLMVTGFSALKPGLVLNIEYDYLLKWAARDGALKQGEANVTV